ncbi:MAG: hypothetical protein ABSH01_07640 [Terriglobia bacterium]|jgi:hypothetical protein
MTKKNLDRAPQLGIFWLINGKLIIDSSPLTEAEPYGNHLGHPRSHIEVWEKYQRGGKVPLEMEYEQAPRGRVMFDRTSDTFTILADKCILRRKDLIAGIKSELKLPKSTRLSTDSHYRCFTCLYGTDDEE